MIIIRKGTSFFKDAYFLPFCAQTESGLNNPLQYCKSLGRTILI